jgi:hypothetical protein
LSLVFKCLTDAIMLDDFQTELNKLGSARQEREEARRRSTALANNLDFQSIPFRDDYDQANGHSGGIRRPTRFMSTVDPMDMNLSEMLTSDAQLEQQMREHRKQRQGSESPLLGRSGKKISQLPSIK